MNIRLHANDKMLLGLIVLLWVGIVVAVENIQLNTKGTLATSAVSSTSTLVAGFDAQVIGSGRFALAQQ